MNVSYSRLILICMVLQQVTA